MPSKLSKIAVAGFIGGIATDIIVRVIFQQHYTSTQVFMFVISGIISSFVVTDKYKNI